MKLLIFTDKTAVKACVLSEQAVNHQSISSGIYDYQKAKDWITQKADQRIMNTPFHGDYNPVAIVFEPQFDMIFKKRVKIESVTHRAQPRNDESSDMEKRLQGLLKNVDVNS